MAAQNGDSYYFAYGSNLSSTQMRQRCPNSEAIGLAHLPSWTWLINDRGYANIVQTNDDDSGKNPGVYGLVYRLDPTDEPSLDRSEGVPWAYEKRYIEMDIIKGTEGLSDSSKAKLLVYVDFKRVTPSTPNLEYVDRMNRGIREATQEWSFPQVFVEQVMRPFIPAAN